MLVHPDNLYSQDPQFKFITGNPEKDKLLAVKCKSEALKYYARFIARYGNVARYDSQNVIENFEELKQNKESGFGWIIWD